MKYMATNVDDKRLTEISQQLEKQYCYNVAEADRVVLNVELMAEYRYHPESGYYLLSRPEAVNGRRHFYG